MEFVFSINDIKSRLGALDILIKGLGEVGGAIVEISTGDKSGDKIVVRASTTLPYLSSTCITRAGEWRLESVNKSRLRRICSGFQTASRRLSRLLLWFTNFHSTRCENAERRTLDSLNGGWRLEHDAPMYLVQLLVIFSREKGIISRARERKRQKTDSKAGERRDSMQSRREEERERERHLRNNGKTSRRESMRRRKRVERWLVTIDKLPGFKGTTLESLKTFFWNSFSLQKSVSRGNHSLISCNRVENALARAKTRLTLVRRGGGEGGKKQKTSSRYATKTSRSARVSQRINPGIFGPSGETRYSIRLLFVLLPFCSSRNDLMDSHGWKRNTRE